MPPWIDIRAPLVNPLGNPLSQYSSATWINLGQPGVLVDFTALGTGTPLAAGTLPGGGTYTQAAGAGQTEETVQTSASTVARWAFVANLPRIGFLADGGIGLVLEPPRTNRALRSDALENASWFVESVAVTVGANATASPTGTVDAESVSWTAAVLRYIGQTCTFALEASTLSVWAKASSGKIRLRLPSQVGVSNVDSADITPTAAWASFQHTVTNATTAGASSALIESDVALAAMSGHMWGAQLEAGKYRTNWIPTGAATASRAGYRVSIPISRYVRGGVFRAVLTTVPHGAATEYDGDSATVRLWTIDANTYAEVNTTTRVLTVSVNGVARVAGVPLWWLRGHRVQWSWEVGNGNLRVRYRYSTDQGATWTLPFDPFGGTVYSDSAISTASSTIDLYSDSGSSKWWGTGVVSEEAILTAPAWALQWLPTDDASVLAWFRADGHYTLSAGLVSAWTSQTAAAVSAAQGTAANQPVFGATSLNGKPGVTFDRATTDIMTVTGLSAVAGNILAVASIKPNSNPNAAAAVFDTQTGRLIMEHSDALSVNGPCYYDGAFRDPGAAGTTLAQILAWDLRASPGGRVYRNGAQIGSTQAYTQRAIGGTVTIGGRYDGTGYGNFVQGDFVLSVAPSDALRRNIEAYLSAKYGIAVS